MPIRDRSIPVCASPELAEKAYRLVDIHYRDQPHSAIVFRLHGTVRAFLNQCVHMPRRLNCERDTVFDAEQKRLRCSMHGIVYDPISGASLSTLCEGERLQALRVREADGQIAINDKRVTPAG